MTVSADALRQLHRIHRQLTDLRSRLDLGPKQVQAAAANLTRMKADVEQAKEQLTKTRVHADDKQLQLRQREDRIKDLQSKLNSCSSNREYQALQEQIAADDQANSVLSDEILEALEKIDEQQEQLEDLRKSFESANQKFENLQQRVETEKSGLEAELDRVQSELSEAEACLPADFRNDYQRITRARGEDALAQVDGETCGACYQVLTPQTINELHMSKPVFCKSCGAVLYLPEDRSKV
jgi:predicted  nucleic acid-binding Zn-ribbon protein